MTNDRTIRLLVPTAGSPPAKSTVEYIVRIAEKLNAEIVVLHVYESSHPAADARIAFDVFIEAAAKKGLKVLSRVQCGSVVETIIDIADRGDYSLVIMGASAGLMVNEWISSQVLHRSQLPVVVIPHSLPEKGRDP